MNLERLKQTVARTSGKVQGTAFLISRSHVLTCAHCLGEEEQYDQIIALYFSRWEEGNRERTASVIHVDWKMDVAVLVFDQEAPVEPLPLSSTNVVNGLEWVSFAHPAQVEKDGFPFYGTIHDSKAHVEGEKVILLNCQDLTDHVYGASGAPLLVEDKIVGILTQQFLVYGKENGEKIPAFKAIYALPIELLRGLSKYVVLATVNDVFKEYREKLQNRFSKELEKFVSLGYAPIEINKHHQHVSPSESLESKYDKKSITNKSKWFH